MRLKRISWLIPLLLFLLALALLPAGNVVAPVIAQSTGDTVNLPSRTPTPRPTATPPPSPTLTTEKTWVGRLVSNTLGVTEGNGSIFRVSVSGQPDALIELRSDDKVITATAGSKPEYGPFAAEFAPVTPATWLVTVPALGVSLPVQADGYNLAVIEFSEVPVTEATSAAAAPATVAGVPAPVSWAGQVTSEITGAGVPFARLLVTVSGRDGQPVQIATFTQVLNTAFTGQKPGEIGPNTVEFTGLTPGTYFIEPVGLGATLRVELNPNTEVRVVFNQITPTATPIPPATDTPIPPPLPTWTPQPTATPSNTPLPTATATASPSPTPIMRWIGAVDRRGPASAGSEATITVQVVGRNGQPVRLARTSDSTFPEHRCVTGPLDSCTIVNLPPGWYMVAPEGIDASLPFPVNPAEAVQVSFKAESLPPGVSGWQGKIQQDTNTFLAQPQTDGLIRVQVDGRAGQVVALYATRLNRISYCETANNSAIGGFMCEFNRLGPGVYRVEALHTGARQSIFVDGAGEAVIEFSPSATDDAQAAPGSSAVVGRGAQPKQATPLPAVIATATESPQIEPPPTASSATPLPAPVVSTTLMITATASPTPAFAWQGRVVETTTTGAGAIGVRVLGLQNQPVLLHSGSWLSPPQLTGTKPELGDYSTEFGGLAAGEYIVELAGLAEFRVTLEGGQYALVEFRYEAVPGE